MYKKNNSCHPVTLEWFSIQLLVNSEIFKLLLNLSLTHLRAQSACYELKGDLSLLMLKEMFHKSLKISKFTRSCMETIQAWLGGKSCFSYTNPSNFLWPLQSLLLRYVWLKIYRLPNFNILFQLMLTRFFKSKLFSCLPKVDHVIN